MRDIEYPTLVPTIYNQRMSCFVYLCSFIVGPSWWMLLVSSGFWIRCSSSGYCLHLFWYACTIYDLYSNILHIFLPLFFFFIFFVVCIFCILENAKQNKTKTWSSVFILNNSQYKTLVCVIYDTYALWLMYLTYMALLTDSYIHQVTLNVCSLSLLTDGVKKLLTACICSWVLLWETRVKKKIFLKAGYVSNIYSWCTVWNILLSV